MEYLILDDIYGFENSSYIHHVAIIRTSMQKNNQHSAKAYFDQYTELKKPQMSVNNYHFLLSFYSSFATLIK